MIEIIGFVMGAICFPITIIAFYFQIRDLKKRTITLASTLAVGYYYNFLERIINYIEENGKVVVTIDKIDHTIDQGKFFIEIRVPLVVNSKDIEIKSGSNSLIEVNNLFRKIYLYGKLNASDNSLTIIEIPTTFTVIAKTYDILDKKENTSTNIYREAKSFKKTLEYLLKSRKSNYGISNVKVVLFEE